MGDEFGVEAAGDLVGEVSGGREGEMGEGRTEME